MLLFFSFQRLLGSYRQECHLGYSDLKVDVTGTISLLESWHILDFLGTTTIRTAALQTTPISYK